MTKEIKPNVDPNIIRVFVVRHGRTEFNSKKIIQGHLDIDIDATGEEQAIKLAKYFDDFNFDACVTSDLVRCRSTIKDILKKKRSLDRRQYKDHPKLERKNDGPSARDVHRRCQREVRSPI